MCRYLSSHRSVPSVLVTVGVSRFYFLARQFLFCVNVSICISQVSSSYFCSSPTSICLASLFMSPTNRIFCSSSMRIVSDPSILPFSTHHLHRDSHIRSTTFTQTPLAIDFTSISAPPHLLPLEPCTQSSGKKN